MNGYANRGEYTIRCKWYKRIQGTNEYEKKTRGIFYAKIVSPLTVMPSVINGKLKDLRSEMTIESISNISEMNADDKVLIRGKELRVERLISEEMTSTEFSARPYKKTQLLLVGKGVM